MDFEKSGSHDRHDGATIGAPVRGVVELPLCYRAICLKKLRGVAQKRNPLRSTLDQRNGKKDFLRRVRKRASGAVFIIAIPFCR